MRTKSDEKITLEVTIVDVAPLFQKLDHVIITVALYLAIVDPQLLLHRNKLCTRCISMKYKFQTTSGVPEQFVL